MRSTKIEEDKIYDVDAYQEDGMGDVIETVGAGDTFIGAFLAYYVGGTQSDDDVKESSSQDLNACLSFASRVASFKVRQRGFRFAFEHDKL